MSADVKKEVAGAMESMKHSPLPWRLHDPYKDDPVRMVDAEGRFVCGDSCGPSKRNAVFIVECANHHEELVHVQKVELPYFKARIARLEMEKKNLRRIVRELLPASIVAGLSNANTRRVCVDAYKALGGEADKLLEGHRQMLDSFAMELPEEKPDGEETEP